MLLSANHDMGKSKKQSKANDGEGCVCAFCRHSASCLLSNPYCWYKGRKAVDICMKCILADATLSRALRVFKVSRVRDPLTRPRGLPMGNTLRGRPATGRYYNKLARGIPKRLRAR